MVVVGAGTGGTVAGIGRKFKENMPNVQVWGEGRGRKGEEEGEEKKRREGGEVGGREEGGEKKEERGKEGRGGRWEVHVQWSGKWKGGRKRGMRGRRRGGGKRMGRRRFILKPRGGVL